MPICTSFPTMSTTVRSSPSTSLSSHHPSTLSTPYPLSLPPRHPQLVSYARPTHPTILVPFDSLLYSLPCLSLHYTAHIHLHTATVTLTARYRQIAAFETDAILALPLPDQAMVTRCTVEVTDGPSSDAAQGGQRVRRIETAVLARKEAQSVMEELRAAGKTRQELPIDPLTSYHPLPVGRLPPLSYTTPTASLFRLPLSALPSASYLSVHCQYEVQLPYTLGCYTLTLPLSSVVSGSGVGCELSVLVRLADAGDEVRYHCLSHELAVNRVEDGEIELQMKQTLPAADQSGTAVDKLVSRDFQLTYTYATNQIQYTVLKQPTVTATSPSTTASAASTAAVTVETGGSLLVHICPPAVESLTAFFTRHYVFILDRSCSLAHNQTFTQLVAALSVSLTNLKPADTFTLLVYDTLATAYTGELISANPATVAAAISWLKGQAPRTKRRKGEDGRVDAREAIETAVRMLETVTNGDDNAIGYMVLVTDGASAVDRPIVDWLTSHKQLQTDRGKGHGLRVLTLGIGRWVNMLWLRRLAEVGGGVCRWVGESERVYSAMVELVQCSSVPVVVDLRLELNHATKRHNNARHTKDSSNRDNHNSNTSTGSPDPPPTLRLYPQPPPDVYLNLPLTLHATYSGQLPTHLTLHGRTPDADWQQTVRIQPHKPGSPPLGGWRERLDVMCARVWAEASADSGGEEACVALSVRSGVVCCYTRMIAYETSRRPSAISDGSEGESEARVTFDVKEVIGSAVLLSGNVLSEGSVEGTIDGASGLAEGDEHINGGCCGWRDWEWHECLQC